MNFFLILCCIFLVIYSCVSWLLPTLLSWLFKRKYHINLNIGRIAVPKLILKDVTLSKDGYIIHINEISFKSSFFNSEINKLVSVVIKNMNITNVSEERRSVVVETILKPLLSKQNSASSRKDMLFQGQSYEDFEKDLIRYAESQLLDFRGKKLPPSLIMFAQFMGVHVFNTTVTIQHNVADTSWSIQGSASELHADGTAGGPTRALVFSSNLVEVKAKISVDENVIGETSCSLLIEGTVRADGPLNVEKIHTSISNPTVLVQDEMLTFIKKHKRKRKSSLKPCYDETEDSISSIIPRLSPVIPKIFSLKIDTTTVSIVENTTKSMFQFTLNSLQINSRFSATSVVIQESGIEKKSLPQVYVALQMDQLQLCVDKEQHILLNKLKLDAKLEKGVLNLYLILSVLNLNYDHSKCIKRYEAIRHKIKKSKPLEIQMREAEKDSVPVWFSHLTSSCVVQGCAEVHNATLRMRLPRSNMAAGFGGIKLKLDQLLDTREEPYTSALPRALLGVREWSAELLVDGGWWSRGAPPSRRGHHWGSALLAVALVKWGSHRPTHSKVEAMMDCLRLEWSPELAESVIELASCINDYRSDIKKPVQPEMSPPSQCDISINVALSHINLFLVINEGMCLMTRIDAVSIESNPNKSGAMVSGMKVVDMIPYKDPALCQKSDEIPVSVFHVKLAKLELSPSRETHATLFHIQFLEITELEWSPNLHLKVVHLLRDIKSFQLKLKEKRDGDISIDTKTKTKLDWRISFKNETNLVLLLSADNNMIFATDDMAISSDHRSGLSISWVQLKLLLNGDEIANVDGFTMERVADDHEVRVERKANENFMLDWNKVWGVSIEAIRVVFPYKHRFAEAVQGDFVSLFKWIKVIHGIKKKPFTMDSPLPSDLHIKIEEILIEMSDDPFEVKLRDNYELLEDEYKESQKRRTMLDAKVQELCKPHLFLPAGKVEELYAALRQKDAQIYVQRSRAAPPPRRRLFACVLTRFSLIALADPSIHGTQNATNMLRNIDSDTPWPEDGVEFSTLWCREVSVACGVWQLVLRDFPQPLVSVAHLRFWGTVLGAEEAPPTRAIRTVTIEQGAPWGELEVERSMMPLKWYYDVCCEMDQFSYAFGPCWEPVIAQCNLAFDQVSRPSLDPSQPLAWWDKVRLLMHGRLTAEIKKFTCLLHVSLDPYNTTEEMEVSWLNLVLDWTNGMLRFMGELNVFVRTASKYDDCRVLRIPGLKLSVEMNWCTVGDSRDHRQAPTAPHKLPDYSSNQEHDSYRAFRSQGLDLHINMDMPDQSAANQNNGPELSLFGSTLRWFESLKLILSGTTRPTRRGRVFNNVRPRKPQLSRHYRSVSVSLALDHLQVCYWSSSSMQRGIDMLCARVTCSSEHCLSLVPCDDGLIRRPRANWKTKYMSCELSDVEIWLKTAAPPSAEDVKYNEPISSVLTGSMKKCYCLSVRSVTYTRDGRDAGCGAGGAAGTHKLAVHDLRGAWTKLNRDLAFALIDTYIKTQQLKKNLSTKALKEEEKPTTSPRHQREPDMASPPPPPTNTQSCTGSAMLAALVAEAGGEAPVVLSDELGGGEGPPPTQHTHHARYVLDDDHAHTATNIELVNSQVVLIGCETGGYVVVCAARAVVRQRVRGEGVAWSGELSSMQYYATVNAGLDRRDDEKIQWVSVEEIEDRGSRGSLGSLDVPQLVGSGHSAGGVIGHCVGPSADPATTTTQLQRIVSRCACEFYYVSSEETAEKEGNMHSPQTPYDSFTLMHHDLDVCTNSLQYAMLLDVVNNVVLHVEPERRRTLERRALMRFQMQLHRDQDPRQLIHKLQTQVRESLAKLRRLEKEYYSYIKNRSFSGHDPVAIEELKALDNQVNECKEQVWSLGEELDAMVRAWREMSEAAKGARSRAAPLGTEACAHRYNEICFQSARWRLTDKDGQLGIADLLLTNFLYTKTSRSDDSVEHQLEVGYVEVTNLLPNEPFPEVLVPQMPSGKAPLARRAALRVFCRDRPPVGGIAVKEHFEINIVPFKIGLTKKFFNKMLKFCFPERDPDTIEAMEGEEEGDGTMKAGTSTSGLVSTGSKKIKKKKESNSNFYVKRDKRDKDDVEKMKERAEKNKLFIFIKIPEVPVRVSYKGSKEKNLEDVHDLPLVLPTLEYHNVTWTWLDLLLATKTDTRRVIISQALRQKLQFYRPAANAPEPHEEDKARLLLGETTVAENKPQKKSTPGVFKFSKS